MEQHVTFRRVAGMLVGIVIISLGVALFKFAHLGNDPFNALNIRSAQACQAAPWRTKPDL